MRIENITEADAKPFFEAISNERERLITYFPITIAETNSLRSTKRYIRSLINERFNKTMYFYLIKNASNEEVVGMVFIKNIVYRVPKAEIGYFIFEKYEGKGITTRAIKGLLSICFEKLKLERVYARIAPTNIGSQKVVLKNGFQLEGRMRNDFRTADGELIDVEMYAILKSDQ